MNGSMLVSVIIPVYNVASYLTEALDSVINQTYEHLEIIVIDDGSTDESGRICDEYKDKDARVRVVHQLNKGLSSARNKGLDSMTGEAVAFLDSDDTYHPNYIQEMVHVMLRDNADMVISKYTLSRSTKGMKRGSKRYPPILEGEYNRNEALCALAEMNINPSVWNKLYKRELWLTERFPEGRVYEDVDTTYRIISLCRKICVLDQSLYLCRIRPDSITKTYTRKHLEDYMRACSHFESYIIRHIPEVFSSNQLEKRLQARLSMMIYYYLRLVQVKDENELHYRDLRESIVKLKHEVGIADCKLRVKISYLLIYVCPQIIQILYPLYGRMRKAIQTV